MWEVIEHISALVGLIAAGQLAIKAWRRFRDWRIQRSRASLEREIDSVKLLAASPAARTDLSQRRQHFALAILGTWIMAQSLGYDDAGRRIVMILNFVCGAGLYLLAAATVGDLMRTGSSAERTIARLQAKLDALKQPE